MKKKYAFVVRVPKTPQSAYDHDRPISSLIEHQLKHLYEAEKLLPQRHQTGVDISTLKTERQASNYIQKVTAKLHPRGARTAPQAKKARRPKKLTTLAKSKRRKPVTRKKK